MAICCRVAGVDDVKAPLAGIRRGSTVEMRLNLRETAASWKKAKESRYEMLDATACWF